MPACGVPVTAATDADAAVQSDAIDAGIGDTTQPLADVPAGDGQVDSAGIKDAAANAADIPPGSSSLACPGYAAVNVIGVGKPCQTNDDCQGQLAVTCPHSNDAKAFDFCTRYCFGLDAQECGPNARCIAQGEKTSVCAPLPCADALEIKPPPDVKAKIPCPDAVANSFGVGKPCKTKDDCAGNTVAKVCPLAIKPTNPAWCSLLCTDDSDCGPDAFCWKRHAVEEGGLLIASCAPKICIIKE